MSSSAASMRYNSSSFYVTGVNQGGLMSEQPNEEVTEEVVLPNPYDDETIVTQDEEAETEEEAK